MAQALYFAVEVEKMRIFLSDEQRLVVATAKRVASEELEPRAAHPSCGELEGFVGKRSDGHGGTASLRGVGAGHAHIRDGGGGTGRWLHQHGDDGAHALGGTALH